MAARVERRLRVRRRADVSKGSVRMNPEAMKFLGIIDKVEVVLVGRRKYQFNVLASNDVPTNEVWGNAEEMRGYGIADNSIATVRKP